MIVNTHGRHDPCVGIRAVPVGATGYAIPQFITGAGDAAEFVTSATGPDQFPGDGLDSKLV